MMLSRCYHQIPCAPPIDDGDINAALQFFPEHLKVTPGFLGLQW